MDIQKEKLGMFIKKARLQRGFNRPEFCQLTSLDPDYLNNIEHGRVPSTAVLIQIAEGLGIRPGVLLDVLAGYNPEETDFNSLNSLRLPEILIFEGAIKKQLEKYVAFLAAEQAKENELYNNDLIGSILNTME